MVTGVIVSGLDTLKGVCLKRLLPVAATISTLVGAFLNTLPITYGKAPRDLKIHSTLKSTVFLFSTNCMSQSCFELFQITLVP